MFGPNIGAALTKGAYCNDAKNIECFLQPLSETCSVNLTGSAVIDDCIYRDAFPDEFRSRVHLFYGNDGEMALTWWRSQAAAYIFRLNFRTASWTRQYRKLLHEAGKVPLPLPRHSISVHVRHGDKIKETPLYSWDEHYRRALNVSEKEGIPVNIFLSTDDPQVVTEASSLDNVFTVPYERTQQDFGTQVHEGSWLFLNSILNLFVAIECEYFVGTQGSNWNRLINELRRVWRSYPGCCTGFEEVGCQFGRECSANQMPSNW